MRTIDMCTWSRSEHFKLYNSFDHPHFNMCANVELSTFLPYLKQGGIPFNTAIVYLISRVSNSIPEFRYRVRDQTVIEHEIVHPSTTILAEEDVFSFCHLTYIEDFSLFAQETAKRVAEAKKHPTLKDKPGLDDLLFMTAIPWVSFTSFMHPIHLNPVDSVPRFAWGKFFEAGNQIWMPLSVQGHHGVMDGIHMAKFYERIQGFLQEPLGVLGAGKMAC